MTGLDMTHVPYSGGAAPATTNLLGGHVQVMFSGGLSSIPYIKTGSLRALAVTTATRWDALTAALVPAAGEHSEIQFDKVGACEIARAHLYC